MQPTPPSVYNQEPVERVLGEYQAYTAKFAEDPLSRVHFMEKLTHDMRSMLACVLGYAELLSDAGQRVEGARVDEYGKVVLDRALRLGRLIDDAMTATLILENQYNVVLKPVSIEPLLSVLTAETRDQSEREIIFRNKLSGAQVIGDALRLRDAFARILDNAVKYSPPNSPIVVTLEEDRAKKLILVKVKDYGIGIADADLPALFIPFTMLRVKHKKSGMGNGLSLFIVKAIVNGLHGSIDVQSKLDAGTTFVLSLPKYEEG